MASILAGLGVGGLAVALAAQKTVENLFGAFSIGADQPFREGDLVRVDDFVGTVEQIGLRSTKFRTADRTLISIPNGKLADMKLETLAVRDRLRFAFIVGLARSTSAQQLRQVLEGFESLLKSHPKLWQNTASVRFEKFGPSSLDLDVSAYFDTRDMNEFQLIRQELLAAVHDHRRARGHLACAAGYERAADERDAHGQRHQRQHHTQLNRSPVCFPLWVLRRARRPRSRGRCRALRTDAETAGHRGTSRSAAPRPALPPRS